LKHFSITKLPKGVI